MAKHSSQGSPDDKSKTIANIMRNLKEHVTKYENHESSCDKCELKATSPHEKNGFNALNILKSLLQNKLS